jgi:hypothetical protein
MVIMRILSSSRSSSFSLGTMKLRARARLVGRRVAVELLESRALLAVVPAYGTGLTSNGGLASPGTQDVHFELISAPYEAPKAYVLNSLPYAYTPNGPNSQWIGPSADPFVIQDAGDYTYRETFDLSAFDPSTVVLTGNLATDNGSHIVLNGVDTGITLAPAYTGASNTFDSLHPFTISSGFHSGLNTFDVIVNNEYSATGLRVDLSGTGEPSQAAIPVLSSAVQDGTGTLITGQATGLPNTTYRIDFYASPTASFPDPSNLPPPIGSTDVATDATGLAHFVAHVPTALDAGSYVFATATSGSGLTSSLSPGQVVTASADLYVAFYDDSGTPTTQSAFPVSYVVTNNGPSPATDVILAETLPAGAQILLAAGSIGTVDQVGDVVRLHIPRLDPGASAKLTASILWDNVDTISTSAVATSAVVDLNPGNDSSRAFIPTVVNLAREGYHRRPTFVTLRFSAPLATVPAENRANYRVVSAGRDGHFGTKDDVSYTIRAAHYNAAAQAVRLSFRRLLPLNRTYQITVRGTPPSGLTSQDGTPLGGRGASQPGTDYVATFDRSAFVRPVAARHLTPHSQS